METEIVIIKLLLAFFLSGLIGIERELKNEAAGLRTHILIGVGAALLMIISIYSGDLGNNADPTRIASQVVSGIGFLGAGAILKVGLNAKGLATAANVWIVAAIGLAIGGGYYIEGIITTVIVLFTLLIISKIKGKYVGVYKYIFLEFEIEKNKNLQEVKKLLESEGIEIVGNELHKGEKFNKLVFTTQVKNDFDIFKLEKSISSKGEFYTFKIKENINNFKMD